MADQNASVPQDQRIEFRIGVHVGDIIFERHLWRWCQRCCPP
jgi:class 3 adenylate cyclase